MAEARASRWYFGGLASCGAACCTHPLDLLKVSLSLKAERAPEPKAPGTVPGLAPTGRLLRPPLDCAPGNYRHAGLSPALRRRARACGRHYARFSGSGGKVPGDPLQMGLSGDRRRGHPRSSAYQLVLPHL